MIRRYTVIKKILPGTHPNFQTTVDLPREVRTFLVVWHEGEIWSGIAGKPLQTASFLGNSPNLALSTYAPEREGSYC